MALRISKDKRDTLQSMVLAHRVAVRTKATASTDSDEWMEALSEELTTEYALDIALSGELTDYKVEYLQNGKSLAAWVARIRLRDLGIELPKIQEA